MSHVLSKLVTASASLNLGARATRLCRSIAMIVFSMFLDRSKRCVSLAHTPPCYLELSEHSSLSSIYLSFLCLRAGAALLAQSPTSPLTVSLQAPCFLGITLSNAEDVDAKGYTDHACQNQGPCVAPDLR